MKHTFRDILFFSVLTFFLLSPVAITQAAKEEEISLKEGDIISSYSYDGDPDIFIINDHGYKRLFLNPAIFGFYGHLTYAKVIQVPPSVKDEFKTSSLYKNCEANDPRVHALNVSGEDEGVLHHVDISAESALGEDADFPGKIFCVNAREFAWYRKSFSYDSLGRIISYHRAKTPFVTVTTPNGGEVWTKGTTQVIRWLSPPRDNRVGLTDAIDISLFRWVEPCRVEPCVDSSLPRVIGYRIVKATLNDEAFEWSIPKNLENVDVPEGRYFIQVCLADMRLCDTSDKPFSITNENSSSLVVVTPNGGETWERGTTKDITWRGSFTGNVHIYLLRWQAPCVLGPCPLIVSPNVLYLLAKDIPNQGKFSWTVGKDMRGNTIPSGQYLVRLTDAATGGFDESDGPFTLSTTNVNLAPVISEVSGPTILNAGETGTWTIKASDPENGTLTYSVVWGDERVNAQELFPAPSNDAIKQTTTFTHSYAKKGAYRVQFTVTDDQGLSAKITISVHAEDTVRIL